MSYPTKPVFIASGSDWDAYRSHPAMAFMEKLSVGFDSGEAKEDPWQDWVADDFVYRKPNGQTFTGQEAWEVNKKDFATFTKQYHQPVLSVVWETATGWEMFGQATFFANLPGPEGAKAATDAKGEKWDVSTYAAFHFEYVKDPSGKHGGIKLKKQYSFADSMPVVVECIKRGIVKPEQLVG